MPLVCQAAVERLSEDRGRFAVAYIHTFNIHKACAEARVKKADAQAWLEEPEVCTAIRLMSDKGMQSQGISYEWILSKQKQILMRCMGEEEATTIDRKGHQITGMVFDAFNANKAIENLAKLTGHMGSGGMNINVNVASLSQNEREKELDRILASLEARQNAGEVTEAEFHELPAPEPVAESMF